MTTCTCANLPGPCKSCMSTRAVVTRATSERRKGVVVFESPVGTLAVRMGPEDGGQIVNRPANRKMRRAAMSRRRP